jgi:hypothetical protein
MKSVAAAVHCPEMNVRIEKRRTCRLQSSTWKRRLSGGARAEQYLEVRIEWRSTREQYLEVRIEWRSTCRAVPGSED